MLCVYGEDETFNMKRIYLLFPEENENNSDKVAIADNLRCLLRGFMVQDVGHWGSDPGGWEQTSLIAPQEETNRHGPESSNDKWSCVAFPARIFS